MRGSNESLLDEATKAHLQRLTDLLKENELIQDYQMIEEKAQNHAHLNQLIADIKIKQKEAVAFNHYGKPEAEKIAIKEAEAFTKEFNEHMIVTSYQDALVEANDILQHLVATVQDELKEQINQTLEDNR